MGCAYSSPRDEAPLRRSVPDSVSGGRLCECPSAKGPRGTQPKCGWNIFAGRGPLEA